MKNCSKKIILFLMVMFFVACRADSLPNNLAFDSAKWKSGDLRVRGRMVYDLKKSNTLKDKTKAEVEGLLGKPDNQKDSKTWLYKVNFGDTFTSPISSQINLNVFFDDQTDQVTGAIFTGGQLLGIF